jgi:hypothetical protein
VKRKPLGVFLPWPLCVSSELGKCFLAALRVNPGHDVKCLYWMVASHVGLVVNPANA